jgi:hypothetical protein
VAWAVYFATTTTDIVASAIDGQPRTDIDATVDGGAAKLGT